MVDGLLTSGEVGKVLGVTAERVRQLERAGILRAMKTPTGRRIYRVRDVDALRRRRQRERQAL